LVREKTTKRLKRKMKRVQFHDRRQPTCSERSAFSEGERSTLGACMAMKEGRGRASLAHQMYEKKGPDLSEGGRGK